MKALVGAFNQEEALVGAFSVIVKTDCETDGALYSTSLDSGHSRLAWLHFYAVVMLCVCSGKENKKYFISISKVERFC